MTIPTLPEFIEARTVVGSDPVIRVFAACEWDELHDDGKVWLATIVREAQIRAKARLGEISRLRMALFAIDQAVIHGKVCDDVAWFSECETLHDFIQSILHPCEPAAIADLFSTEGNA